MAQPPERELDVTAAAVVVLCVLAWLTCILPTLLASMPEVAHG